MPGARAGSLGLRLFAPVAASWPHAARQQDVRVHPGDESEPAGCVAYLGSLLSCDAPGRHHMHVRPSDGYLARGNRASFLFFVLLGSELSSLPPVFFSGRSS